MGIPNPVPPVKAKLKKVNPKVAVIALGGGVVLFLIFRSHKNNVGTEASSEDPTVTDSLSSPGADQYPVSLGQGAAPLPAVDFGSPTPAVDGVDGVGAVDDPASGTSDLGTLTLNIVGLPVDAPSGNDSSPGTSTGVTSTGKAKSTKVIKTLADLPYSTRKKIADERKKGNVDKYGRTPTERSAARHNAGIRKQLDNRLKRERKHRAGGGPTKRQHPTHSHGQPKRPIRKAPVKHVAQPKQSHPKGTPQPGKKRKAKSKAKH